MTRKLLVLPLLALALGLAACGGDDDDSNDTGATTQEQTTQATTETAPAESAGATELTDDADASGALKFEKDKLEAKAGKVTITMNNPSSVPHGIELEGNGVEEEGEVVDKGGKSVVTAELKPGEYEFYCPVPGHQDGGMEGTLTVK